MNDELETLFGLFALIAAFFIACLPG